MRKLSQPGPVSDHGVVAFQLAKARLPAATATRPGWYVGPHHDAVAVVFWCIDGRPFPDRPTRMAGLGSVIDVLVGRWDLAMHGRHRADGAPVCVLVSPRRRPRESKVSDAASPRSSAHRTDR